MDPQGPTADGGKSGKSRTGPASPMRMKTVDEIRADWRRSRDDVAAREAHWRERRRLFNRRAIIASAIVYALSFRFQAYGGSFMSVLWIPTLAVGALAAWPIVRWRLGPLLAAPVFTAVTMGWELFVFAIGGFTGADICVPGGSINPGGPLIMVSTWGFWVCFGIILGFMTDQEDDDTLQV